MRSAAMAGRHSASLGADHRRILEAIEDHAVRWNALSSLAC